MNKALRKLLVLVLAIVVSASAIVGGTYAWFTDTVTSGRNTIQSGNLDMVVSYKPYGAENTTWTEVTKDTKVFKENALYEPGYTEAVWLKIENVGNLAFRYQAALNILSETQGTNQAGDRFKLSDSLVVKSANVTDTSMESIYPTRASLDSFAFGSAANSFEKGLNSEDLTITTNGVAYPENDPVYGEYSTSYVLVILEMPTTVGNEANHNGKAPAIQLGLNVLATQLVHEEDSFGKDYDGDANYPVIKEYVRKLNAGHSKTSTISTSTGPDFLPIVAVNPEIYGYSIYDEDIRITDAVLFRFSGVEKRVIDENTYKVLVDLAVLDENGNELELKPSVPSTINGKEYLHVYMNLIEVPEGYSVKDVKVNGTAFTKTTNSNGNPATGEYWIGYNPKDIYLQSMTDGLIEVTVTKA